MTRLWLTSASLALAATLADAEVLRPAPDYYLDAVVAVTAAEALARSCSTLSVDPEAAVERSGAMLERLAVDGFDTTRADAGMEDPSEELNARLLALMERHGLRTGASEEAVCGAARAEMAAGGMLEGYLVEVPG